MAKRRRRAGANKYAVEDPSSFGPHVIVLEVPSKELFSSNTQLAPGKTKTGRPYLYLSEDARKYKKWIAHVLELRYGDQRGVIQSHLKHSGYVELILAFYVRERRDTTNMVKTVEDAIAEWIGVDDGLWSRVSLIRLPSMVDHEGFAAIFILGGDGGL